MNGRAWRVVGLVCLAWAAQPTPAEEQAADPLAGFARSDEVQEASLSPGGTTLALVLSQGGRRVLGLLDLASHRMVRCQLEGGGSVGHVAWASDRRLVTGVWEQQGSLATPRDLGELYAIDADGKGGRLVFGYRAGEMQTGSHIRKAQGQAAWARVVSRVRGEAHHLLIATESWEETGDRLAELYRMDAVTGLRTLVARAPIRGARFLADEAGRVRLAWGAAGGAALRFFVRDDSEQWTPLEKLSGVPAGAQPVGYSARERSLYLVEEDAAGFAVVAVSIDSGARRELARNGLVPPSDLVFGPANELVAVEFTPDLPSLEYVLPEHPIARALRGLAATYPDARIQLLDRSDDGRRLLVEVSSDRDPGRFLLVDAGTLAAEQVARVRPWVKPEDGAEVSAFHIKASDGFRLHGYVTLPRTPGAAPPPMVLLPHGGPHGVREVWGYDATAQLLASQGFAVLQVNYRGSGGYGRAYEEAGYGHWGDRMVLDLVDATRFAVRKGWADPGRICAFGASYGAYAALQAALLAPELYRCAVGYAGVYDLERLPSGGDLVDSPAARAYLQAVLGSDVAALRRASPAHQAARLTAPVLLVHGADDQRAPLDQAERMRKALTAAGRSPAWLVEPGEGHGFVGEAARARLQTRLLAFLREHTAPREAPAPVPGGG